MPVQITSVTGINVVGNVPQSILVEGTVSGCETLYVTSSCTTAAVSIGIPTGANQTWSVTLPNNNQCPCGTQVKVSVSCISGMPAGDTQTFGFALQCDTCCTVVVDPPVFGPCVGTKRTVTLSVHVTCPTGVPSTLYWDFGDGTAGSPSSSPPFAAAGGATTNKTVSHDYATPGPYVAALKVFAPAGCPDKTVNVGPLASCTCPPGTYLDPATNACVTCPTSLGLAAPVVTGCAGNAVVSFAATPAVGMTAAGYSWTVTRPDGTKADKVVGAAGESTSAGWSGPGTTAGAVNLNQAGTYSVAAVAQLTGAAANCTPIASQTFVVPPCVCPSRIANASNEWQVSNTTAPLGPAAFQTIPCGTATVQISLAIDKGSVPDSDLRYSWDFGDGSTAGPLAGPAGASQNHTFTNPSQTQGKTYSVTVTVTTPTLPSCGPVTTHVDITVPGCPPPPGGNGNGKPPDGGDGGGGCGCCLCQVLLVLALVLLALAAVALVVFACVTPNPVVLAVGIVAAIVGLLLLALWAAVCGAASCSILKTLFRTFTALAAAAAVIGAIFAIFGTPGNTCWIGWIANAGLFSMAATIVANVGEAVGCSVWK